MGAHPALHDAKSGAAGFHWIPARWLGLRTERPRSASSLGSRATLGGSAARTYRCGYGMWLQRW
jgi:hypothetical protein